MAEKLSVIMSTCYLEAADVALLVIDATEGVAAADANIGGYAHESGRSVIIVVNKWDLMTEVGPDGKRLFDGGAPADKKVYEQQVRDSLKYLDYAPLLFVSAAESKGVEEIFKKVELVARERRKRISTGAMNRILYRIDFQRASVPMNRRVKIYYMTQAARWLRRRLCCSRTAMWKLQSPASRAISGRASSSGLAFTFIGKPDPRCAR